MTAPPGWDQLLDSHKADPTSGFEAISFRRGTEIVISYAGTYPKDVTGDIAADLALGAGGMSAQLTQAVDYYLKVRAANAGAAITLTGHSLGGGLAALVGVFFGVEAHTFDQAPFAQSARVFGNPTNVATQLRQYLAGETLTGNEATVRGQMVASLDDFIAQRAANGGIPNTQYVTNINVKGELLSGVPWNIFDRIGSTVENIDLGAAGLTGDQLHDMGLLTAAKLNDGFRQAALKLPDFLKLLFDSTLYWKETDTADPNLLYQLLRHQIGVRDPVTNAVTIPADGMLDRFTADLLKVANTGGLAAAGDLTKALIAFALQAYYEGPNATTADRELFKQIGGGIEFLRSDVAASLGEMKGYDDFQTWLAGLDTGTWNVIQPKLENLLDWYVAGQYLNATAGNQAALMLGAGQTDNLTGGSQADVLVGMGGNDRLAGNGGDDLLLGGMGADLYRHKVGDGHDRIIDPDAASARILATSADGNTAYNVTTFIRDKDNPNLWKNPDGQVTLAHGDTWQLQTGGGGIDLGQTFADGDYGIHLKGPDTVITPTNTVMGTCDGDNLSGTGASDLIDGQGGNDILGGADGNDKLLGGDGDDDIVGQLGDDLVVGGAGHDRLGGNNGDDRLYAENETTLADAIAAQDGTATGAQGDILAGAYGADQVVGDTGNDILFGGRDDDILIGGAGDDTIEADREVWSVDAAWSVDRQTQTAGDTTTYQPVYAGMNLDTATFTGNDTVHAGGGDDWVLAGAGDDWVDGGQGNDVIFGNIGADILQGGTGDDVIDGDNREDATSATGHGNDLLDGGAGNDELHGDGGDDRIIDPDAASTGLGSAIGTRLDVLTEPSLNSHSIVLLTDVLKVSRGGAPSNDTWELAA
ncbi:MAG: hypothetical protein IPP18_16240 [Rhodocyclaceae bacterium]|nr:hypothetical protein [Rhodocyclaceae bacterium]